MSALGLLLPVLVSIGYVAGRRRPQRRAAPPVPWRAALLLLEAGEGNPPLPALAQAVAVACRLAPAGESLHVLAAIRLPLAVPLEAPPGEETEHMATLLQYVERLAGRGGIAIRTHLRRGRNVRTMLRETVQVVGADLVILVGTPHRLGELAQETGAAQAVLVSMREGGPADLGER